MQIFGYGRIRFSIGVAALALTFAIVAACTPTPAPATPKAAAPAPPIAAPKPKPAAKAAPAPKAQPKDERDDTLKVGVRRLWANADSHFAGPGTTSATMFPSMFDSLVIPQEGALIPSLALEWRIIDPTTWEFTLRKGIKFAGGRDFDAEAVKFNVERIINPAGATSVLGARFASLAGAEVVSPTVVRITTKKPDPILPNRMGFLYLVSPDYPAEAGDEPAASRTDGTGPFQSTELVPSQSYTLTFEPGSWRAGDKDVALQTVEIVAIPEPAVMLAAIKTGEIDIAVSPSLTQAKALVDDGLEIQSTVIGNVFTVWMNIVDEPSNSPLRIKGVRQALNYAVDKNALREVAYGGFGRVLDGQVVGPDATGYNPDLKPYEFDSAKATQLLEEANYDEDTTFPFAIAPNSIPFAEPLQGMWADVGVKTEIEVQELPVLVAKLNAGELNALLVTSLGYAPVFDADSSLFRFSNALPEVARIWGNEEFHDVYYPQLAGTRSPEATGALTRGHGNHAGGSASRISVSTRGGLCAQSQGSRLPAPP